MTIVMTMVKKARSFTASAFKAQCLALMDDVARTGEPVVITKRGKPIAQLAPATGSGRPRRSAFGMHKGMVMPIGTVDLDEPVIDPAEWTADEENVRSKP
jgi:prevent-host-death family protein